MNVARSVLSYSTAFCFMIGSMCFDLARHKVEARMWTAKGRSMMCSPGEPCVSLETADLSADPPVPDRAGDLRPANAGCQVPNISQGKL